MSDKIFDAVTGTHNYVFIGGTGSGKSEIAVNIALGIKAGGQNVEFFDLDQTKPLFRSRDVKQVLTDAGIVFHYEEQFYDAPTLVGGVSEKLQNENTCCILDVGGNEVGSRAIGGFASLLNRADCTVFFVVNPFRPWSKTLVAIDETLSAVLKASGVANFHIVCNLNIGTETTANEALKGVYETEMLLADKIPIDFVSVREEIADAVGAGTNFPVFPLKLYLSYPWIDT